VTNTAAINLLTQHARATDQYLHTCLSSLKNTPPRLLESITYSLSAGGKRLRPALVLEFARACDPLATGNSQLATASAAAIELIHTFSLVHDDLPSMDDDDLRRGRPTNHKVFGEALAILAGDAMTTLAFQLLAHTADSQSATRCASLISELASASGPEGMIGGQVLDIASEGTSLSLQALQPLHSMKTGALLRAACRMGVIAAGGSDAQLTAATAYGSHLGLAFQITDDLLDLTSTKEELGKATQKDQSKGKNTYPALLGIEGARAAAASEIAAAHAALTPFGPPAQNLHTLADFVLQRTR
jgi:geranylgeranyl diphosphate synthase type II